MSKNTKTLLVQIGAATLSYPVGTFVGNKIEKIYCNSKDKEYLNPAEKIITKYPLQTTIGAGAAVGLTIGTCAKKLLLK
jgi:hypothetical protein